MSAWTLSLAPVSNGQPRFLQIAQAVMHDVRRGRLVAGQKLPGSRPLATQLGVHRNTVLAAIAELEGQGWLTTTPTRGTFVSSRLPEQANHTPQRHSGRLGYALPAAPSLSSIDRDWAPAARGVITLSSGAPDPRLFPVDALARAWRRVVKRRGRALLSYGHPAGYVALRQALAQFVSSVRGVAAEADNVLTTRGSQMALDLAAKSLLRPGDVVAVEALGYQPAWDALRQTGATVLPIRVDDDGLDVDALERLARRGSLKAVYVTPHHQYPTTHTMAPARRLALLTLARRHRFAILEDDYDHEFHFDARPVLPLASADEHGNVVYIGTLSKVLAPGLRLGFVVAPASLIERMTALRAVMDRQGDHPMEAAVAELIEDGELQRHMRKMRVTYAQRRDALVDALRVQLGDSVRFDVPRGGIALWVKTRLDAERWADACAARGLLVSPGRRYRFDGRALDAFRLVYSQYSPSELRRAVEVMAACRP